MKHSIQSFDTNPFYFSISDDDSKKTIACIYMPKARGEGKYPNSLFNKRVRTANEDHIGHVMKETDDKIVVFGQGNERFDIPKSEILEVGRNVIVKKNFPDLFTFKVDMNAPLPTGEPLEKIDEAYPEYYHGARDDEEGKQQDLIYPK